MSPRVVYDDPRLRSATPLASNCADAVGVGMTGPKNLRANQAHTYPPFFAILAQESRRATDRLKTGASGWESTESTVK